MGEQDFEKFFEENAVDGVLPEEAVVRLLVGDTEGENNSGDAPDSAPTEEPATNEPAAEADAAPEGDGKPDADEEPVILAKDGKNVIPYEKLVEARNEAKAAREEREALLQEMESIKAQLAAKADDGKGEPAPADMDAELEALKEELSDLPEVVAFVEKFAGSKLSQIDMLRQKLENLEAQVEPIRRSSQDQAIEAHFQAIRTAHPDADNIVDSKEFTGWLDGQPSFVRETYNAVLERGSAQQVAEMFSAFKAATPAWGKATGGETPAPKQKPMKTQDTPRSLSDIPAGSPPVTDEAEAIMQMSDTGRMFKMLDMDNAKREDLLRRLV